VAVGDIVPLDAGPYTFAWIERSPDRRVEHAFEGLGSAPIAGARPAGAAALATPMFHRCGHATRQEHASAGQRARHPCGTGMPPSYPRTCRRAGTRPARRRHQTPEFQPQ